MFKANTYAQFFRYASQPTSFVFAKDRTYEYGKAALIELETNSLDCAINTYRPVSNVYISDTARYFIECSKRNGFRTFAIISYDKVIGMISVEYGRSIVRFDPTNYHLHSATTHQQIAQWRSAVDVSQTMFTNTSNVA